MENSDQWKIQAFSLRLESWGQASRKIACVERSVARVSFLENLYVFFLIVHNIAFCRSHECRNFLELKDNALHSVVKIANELDSRTDCKTEGESAKGAAVYALLSCKETKGQTDKRKFS